MNTFLGTPNELEYRIQIGDEPLTLAVNYMLTSPPYQKIPYPAALEDDVILPTPGGVPPSLNFSPEQWAILTFQ